MSLPLAVTINVPARAWDPRPPVFDVAPHVLVGLCLDCEVVAQGTAAALCREYNDPKSIHSSVAAAALMPGANRGCTQPSNKSARRAWRGTGQMAGGSASDTPAALPRSGDPGPASVLSQRCVPRPKSISQSPGNAGARVGDSEMRHSGPVVAKEREPLLGHRLPEPRLGA